MGIEGSQGEGISESDFEGLETEIEEQMSALDLQLDEEDKVLDLEDLTLEDLDIVPAPTEVWEEEVEPPVSPAPASTRPDEPLEKTLLKSSLLEKESPFDVDTMSRGEFEVSVADDIGLEEDDEVELDLEDLATLVKEINADESLGGSLEKEEHFYRR